MTARLTCLIQEMSGSALSKSMVESKCLLEMWQTDRLQWDHDYHWSLTLTDYGMLTLDSKGSKGAWIPNDIKFRFTVTTERDGSLFYYVDSTRSCTMRVAFKYADIKSIIVEKRQQ